MAAIPKPRQARSAPKAGHPLSRSLIAQHERVQFISSIAIPTAMARRGKAESNKKC